MSIKLSSTDLEKLSCEKCGYLLSVPPVTFGYSGFFCGRCPSKRPENSIYEILAENLPFPCRYESSGCKEKYFFNLMKTHETICPKKPYLCPILPVGRCLWRGISDDILNHLKTTHPKCVTDAKILELNLNKNVESCTAFLEDGVCFLIRLVYNKAEGLTIGLLEVGTNFRNFSEYEIHLHSRDFTKTIKLSSRCITHYTSTHKMDEEQLIGSNVLSFVTNETIFMEIVFVQPQTKLDKNMLNLLECPVCTELMTSIIYQCKTGHSFCDICIKKLACCPICKQELTNTFNYGLMALSAQVYLPCKNKEVGCCFEGFPSQLKKHEMLCFRYECPLKISKGCAFNGKKNELLEHCIVFHEHLQRESYNIKWSLKIMNSTITKIICAYDNVFKSSRKFTGNEVLWNVQFCGRDEEAKEYTYTIEFENEVKKITFSDVCRSVTNESNTFDDCLSMPYYQFAPFVSNHICKSNVYIKKNKSI